MTGAFLDTNILVYHLTQNHERYWRRSSALMDDLAAGLTTATCASTVILETIYVLEKGFRIPRAVAYPALRSIVNTPTIEFDFRGAILDALEYWHIHSPLSYADCYHLVLAKSLGLTEIYTFDKKMGRYPGIERVEP